MESILRGIVSSTQHKESLKDQLLQRFLSSMNRNEVNSADCTGLFKLYIEWILVSEKPELNKIGHSELVKLATVHRDHFRDFISPNLIIDIFGNSMNSNKAEIAPLIGDILNILKSEGDSEIDDGLIRSVTNIAKVHLVHFLRDQGVHLEVAASIGKLYNCQSPTLLPAQPEWQKVTSLVVKLLSGYRCHDPHPVTNVVSTSFVEKADLVSDILTRIWGQSLETRECIEEGLRLFYVIISSSDSYSRPSCALMSFIDKVPSTMMEKALETIIDEKGSSANYEEGRTVVGLLTMVEWLTQRPSTLLSGWLMHMLFGLKKSLRYSVLIDITHGTLEKLLVSLSIPELQDSVEPLFFYLFLGFQHSETSFHRTLAALPNVLTKLHKNIDSPVVIGRSKVILERLVEATYFMLELFPGFPDLYEPIYKKLKQLSIDPPNEARTEELKTLAWLNFAEIPKGLSEDFSVKPTISALTKRSETGMVGLVNLGNTCYMNSVLQALYITREFTDTVLSMPIANMHQPVLMKLQQTFAFLRHTLRSIYSPSEFLKIARPPWFESGRQQDCSEFLRYLLDILQEQDKIGRNVGTQREHKFIEPPKNSEEVLMEIVKSSCSINALDSISEAPEASADVDMLSQEGSCTGGDEDFVFGSRSSLAQTKVEDSDSEDGGDIRGSQNSLGGLQRWTTEENLSFSDPRGSRSELSIEAALNDTHSNSTDSGIQSVGDSSIRGSSDSMSNGAQAEAGGQNSVLSAVIRKDLVNSVFPCDKPFISFVHKVFGGQMQTSYECSNCKSLSMHKETFTDLHLAFPAKDDKPQQDEKLTMQTLVNNYLQPEVLQGENCYHCDHCGNLQEATKTMKITQGPDYLMTTLMRFHYDRAQNRKSKVFTDIDYELEISLPVKNCEDQGVKEELYSLYAIVVHSGYSSDGGHYYTYAREPMASNEFDNDLEAHNSSSTWYVFNDSKVSFSSFQSFKTISKRFPRDTAYLLFYQKINKEQALQDSPQLASTLKLRAELKMSVENDNIKFMREKERSSSSSSKSDSSKSNYSNRRGDDDDMGRGGGCGGGGFKAPGRYVC